MTPDDATRAAEWEARLRAEGLPAARPPAGGYNKAAAKAASRADPEVWGYAGRKGVTPAAPGLRKTGKVKVPDGVDWQAHQRAIDRSITQAASARMKQPVEQAPAAWPSLPCDRLVGLCSPSRTARGQVPDDLTPASFVPDIGLDAIPVGETEEGETPEEPAGAAVEILLDADGPADGIEPPDVEPVAFSDGEPVELGTLGDAVAVTVDAERARLPHWPWFTTAVFASIASGKTTAAEVARHYGARAQTLRNAVERISSQVREQMSPGVRLGQKCAPDK